MYTYTQIFKQALKITWHNPVFWFFGFWAFLLGGIVDLELFLGNWSFGGQRILLSFYQGLAEGGLFTLAGFQGLLSNPFYFFLIILIFLTVLGLSILVLWLGIISQAVLIKETISLSQNKPLYWAGAFRSGLAKFWPVLGLNALMRVLVWLFLLIIGILALLKFSGSIIVFILGFNLFIALNLVISFIAKYAICGAVLKDWNFIETIKSAWKIFGQNWLVTMEIAVMLFLINLAVNSILLFFSSRALIYALMIQGGFFFNLITIVLAIIIIFVFVQIFLAIFHWTTWAIVFELLTGKKPVLTSRLESGFRKLFG